LKDICDQIDAYILTKLSCDGIKFFGFAELVKKTDQYHPVTIPDRKQVAIDDRFDGIMYHRILSSGLTQPEEWQRGNISLSLFSSRMRTLLALKVKKFAEEYIFDFNKAMPDVLDIDGYHLVDVTNNVGIITDQEAVYKTEFGDNSYEKHILNWNIYAIEYNVEFIKC
jgi:hypothetical protein